MFKRNKMLMHNDTTFPTVYMSYLTYDHPNTLVAHTFHYRYLHHWNLDIIHVENNNNKKQYRFILVYSHI